MKTIKITTVILIAILVASCGSYYRIVTTLDHDGKAHREIYTKGDSAFLAGDMSQNPYLFDVSDWDVVRLDSAGTYKFFGEEKDVNVKIKKTAASIDLFSKNLRYDERKKSLAAPEENLSKEFRWFYTYYKFTGVYKKAVYEVPVSIDKYMTKEEQKIWSQGDFSGSLNLNDFELNDRPEYLKIKFKEWYSRNSFEISLGIIEKYSGSNISDEDKDTIYSQIRADEQTVTIDITPDLVCRAMDTYYNTNAYSLLFDTYNEKIEQDIEKAELSLNILSDVISYELVVPGKIVDSNSPMIASDTLTWKVDSMRILFDDYTLTAEYRIVNIWAFVLSGLIVVVALFSCIMLWRRKKLSKL